MPTHFPVPHQTTFAAFALGFSLLASSLAQEGAGSDEVLGTVGKLEVKVSDLRQHLDSLGDAEREALAKEPTAFSQYVRALLVQRLVLEEAIAKEWDKSAVVAERMRVLREGVVANTWLESVGEPPADYPTEADVKVAYEANRDTFLEPKAWQLAQIFVSSVPAESNVAADPEAKVKRIAEALKKDPASFATLAATESEEPVSAAKQGEIGWLPEPRIHPDIRTVLPGLALGAISEPVRMDDGWHFIKVLDIREARVPTLEQIREPLAERLRAEKARLGTEAYLAELLREHPIAINEMVLSKLLPPPAP
ncbi:MAG: peptidylprolyl isomerase [Verrucomicrobiales bacterium]|nr:peptidylprolyl isomerase [Verrucomicrobiales bacterium]